MELNCSVKRKGDFKTSREIERVKFPKSNLKTIKTPKNI